MKILRSAVGDVLAKQQWRCKLRDVQSEVIGGELSGSIRERIADEGARDGREEMQASDVSLYRG